MSQAFDFVSPLVLCYVHGAANVRLRVEDKIIRQSMIYMIEVFFYLDLEYKH